MKKIDKILFKILIAAIFIFVFSMIFSNKAKNAPKAIESAILNPSHKNEVGLIEIEETSENGNDKIRLKKQGDFWLLFKTDDDGKSEICSFADKKIINALLENASKIRKIYKIGDIKNNDSFIINNISHKNEKFSIAFYQNDSRLYTKVQFRDENSLKNRINFRSEGSKIIYECENDFHQFLNTGTNYWSEGEIFPEIENPVEIKFLKNERSEVSGRKIFVLGEKSENFSSKSRMILSLRHGKISNCKGEIFNSFAKLTIQDGSGRIANIEFFEKSMQNEKTIESPEFEFFYKKNIIPSEIDSQENAFAFYSENAIYEISAWTYEKIKSLFLEEN